MSAIFSLDGKALLTRSGNDEPFLTVKAFEIEKPGVYTLEGPNGSGKSMFIRFLTGTLPGAIEQNFGASLYINGKIATVYNYRDAVRHGIISVFQDDDLISSMTVFENILLRHSTSTFGKIGHFAWALVHDQISGPITTFVRVLGPALSSRIQRIFDRVEPKKIDWKDRELLRNRAKELLIQHGVPPEILDEMPARLSGGGHAAAKLVCAQLHENTKVLLLDEAFNGVEIGVWPRFIDGLKAWAQKKGTVVVAVTHSSDELLHWDPQSRFKVTDGVFVVEEQFKEGVKRYASPPRQISTPIFELAAMYPEKHALLYTSLWRHIGPGSEMIAIIDRPATDLPPIIDALYRYIPAGYTRRILSLSEVELQDFNVLITRIQTLSPTRFSVLVVAGNPRFRALCSIALSVIADSSVKATIVIPESFDDAVGGILSYSVNANIAADSSTIRLDAPFSPDVFVVPLDDLNRLDSNERKLSLVRCLRLGLLFNERLFFECHEALRTVYLEAETALKIVRHAVSTLNQIGDLGPQSAGIGRIARFGEAHGAMVEKITAGKTAGGRALMLGMMLEATLSRSKEIREALKLTAHFMDISFPTELREAGNWSKIGNFYGDRDSDWVEGERRITNLAIRNIGQFSVQNFRERLASSPGKQNKDLPRFANVQAEGALQQTSIHELQIAISELALLLAKGAGGRAKSAMVSGTA